jgi:hypothetical protein
MKIRSTGALRSFIKTNIARIDDPRTDHNFIGSYTGENRTGKKGFFTVMHGIKPDIPGYLQSILKIAEDGQAVYEFIQNAVDCDSSQFWIYFNQDYFIAINNGTSFEINELASILNIAQSEKRNLEDTSRCGKIGRFGIGFKLVHRLVGENDGSQELTTITEEGIKGPIMFSWSSHNQLLDLLKEDRVFEQINLNNETKGEYLNSPWLLKIILTNFPAAPNESAKDFNYQRFIPFPLSELLELKGYLKSSLGDVLQNRTLLSKGSLFFIKLGKGKSDRLSNESVALEIGVNHSMSFFKKLQKITINSTEITKKNQVKWIDFEIGKNETEFAEIQPEYLFCPIKIAFGYYTNFNLLQTLHKQPNFFKYFPLGEEVNKMCVLIHCDAFDIASDRRKIHQSVRNEKIFKALQDRLERTFLDMLDSDQDSFKWIFLSILFSEIPEEGSHLSFIKGLKEFFNSRIPILEDVKPMDSILLKAFKAEILPEDFGIQDSFWFSWNFLEDEVICRRAKDELGLEKYELKHLIIKGDPDAISTFFFNCSTPFYLEILSELEKEEFTKSLDEALSKIKWIKTISGKMISADELYSDEVWALKEIPESTGQLLLKLGKETTIQELNYLKGDLADLIFPYRPELKTISSFFSEPENQKLIIQLSVEERFALESLTKSNKDSVAAPLFKSKTGELFCLTELVSPAAIDLPDWLDCITLDAKDFASLNEDQKKLLVFRDDIFEKVILSSNSIQHVLKKLKTSEIETFYAFLIDLPKPENLDKLAEISFLFSAKSNAFYSHGELYFPKSLIGLPESKFSHVLRALESVTNLVIPQYSSINLLKSLLIESKPISVSSEIAIANKIRSEDINDFLDWLVLNEEFEFLESYLVDASEESYEIKEAEGKVQFYSPDLKLISYIQTLDKAHSFILFDKNLYASDRSKIGLKEGEELIDKLLTDGLFDEDLIQFFPNRPNQEMARKFLLALPELSIETNTQNKSASSKHKIVQLAVDVFSEDEEGQLQFRSKITIDGHSLEDRAISDDIFFSSVNGEQSIELKTKLSEVMDQYKERSYSLTSVANAFPGIGISNLKKVLGPKKKSPKAILKELQGTNLERYSAVQTFFVAFYNSFNSIMNGFSDIPSFVILYEEDESTYQESAKEFLTICMTEGFFIGFADQLQFPDIDFSTLVLDFDFALREELPPKWLEEWINEEEDLRVDRHKFLSKLNSNSSDSPTVKLRKALLDNIEDTDLLRTSITNKSLFANTLVWLEIQANSGKIQLSESILIPLYKRANNLNISINQIPIPVLINIEPREYQLIDYNEDAEYHMFHEDWADFKKEIFSHLEKGNRKVVDSVLPKKYIEELKAKVLSPIEDLDYEFLNDQISDFNLSYFLSWDQKDKFPIKVFNGTLLPYVIEYQSEGIKKIEKNQVDEADGYLLVSVETLDSIPGSIKKFMPPELYKDLNSHKKDFEDQAEKKKFELDDKTKEELERLLNRELGDNEMENASLIALFRCIKFYQSADHIVPTEPSDIDEALDKRFLSTQSPTGEKIRILFRSARGKLLRLSYSAWFDLQKQNTVLFILTGNGETDYKIFSSQEDLADKSEDAWVMKVGGENKLSDLNRLIQGEFALEKNQFDARIQFLIRLGTEEYQSIFEKLPQIGSEW